MDPSYLELSIPYYSHIFNKIARYRDFDLVKLFENLPSRPPLIALHPWVYYIVEGAVPIAHAISFPNNG
jgi:hypothetical protein